MMPDSTRNRSLESSYDVVVVGAGNGGLSAALQLALAGAKPLLLEQHNIPGGFATSFVRGRFEFDASLHQLSDLGSETNKGTLREFLEDEAKLGVDYLPVNEAYRLILTDDKIDVTLPYGIDAFSEAIDKEVPGSGKIIKDYLLLCKDVFEAIRFFAKLKGNVDAKTIMAEVGEIFKSNKRPLKEISDMAVKIGNLLKTAPYSVDEVTDTFNLPDKARTILYPYWCYLGPPTSRLSFTIWAAMLINYMEKGGWVPRGRSQEMTMAMDRRIRELGGHVEYNTRVEKILVKNGRVTGVETSNGDHIKTDYVISNASPTLVYNKLIHPKTQVPDTAHKYVNARGHGLSSLTVFLGLDASPEELGITDYGYFVAPNMNTDEIYDSFCQLGLTKMQAVACLNLAHPECSPPGTTTLTMTTLYKPEVWHDVKPEDYHRLKNQIAEDMIRQFEEATGTNIKEHVEEIEVATPATFARYTRTYDGIIYGYECDPWDSLMPRAMAAEDEKYIKGLEFAGGFAVMCHGYSTTITSGRMAAGNVLNQMGVTS